MRLLKKSRVAITALVAVTSLAAGIIAPAAHADPAAKYRYTLVGFSNASDKILDVYQSSDATTFTEYAKGAYQPASGRVRDPSILHHTDGKYYLTYTTADGANIGFARSDDLRTWTQLANVDLPFCCWLAPGSGDGKGPVNPLPIRGVPGFRDGPSISPFVTKSWAPEFFVDNGKTNVIVSLSTGGGFIPYVITALDPGLTKWSHPTPLGGIGADHIDTTVVKDGATYHVFTKNETKKVIEHYTSPTLGGPYTKAGVGSDWGDLLEGPSVVQLPNGNWRIYVDAYKQKKYFYSDSTDGMKTWSKLKELPGLSGTVRHFSVLREPA